MEKTKVAICENCGLGRQQTGGYITWGDVTECPRCGAEVNTFWVEPIPSIVEQVEDNYERLKRNNRTPRGVSVDSLEWRIGRRLRKLAKLYDGIEGYYHDENVVVNYIMQIIRQAIEEVKNEKDNN